MAKTFVRQDTQIRQSDTYTDNIAASEANFETNPTNIQDDLNNIRSQLHNLLNNLGGNWWDDLITPSALDTGTERGVNNLNTDLHALERKRVLVAACTLADVAVTAAAQHEILAAGELPTNTTIAVGAVTTQGTVAAQASSFNTASASDIVSGATAISPKNMVDVVDGTTRDPILDSSGKRIYGLLQSESGTDGHTATDTTPTRLQVSFVVINATGDGLQLAAGADIGGKTVNLCFTERKALEDLTEQDFLRGATTDVPGSAVVNRQQVYDNQGVTPVDVTTNSTLDLEGAGLFWEIRDDLEARLFAVIEGSAGGTSSVQIAAGVDTFDVDAVANDFLNGASFDTGAAGTTINVGVTPNQIDSGGALTLASGGAGNLILDSTGGEVEFDDVYRLSSTYTGSLLRLADSAQEWTDFETAFGGEVSLLAAIVEASNTTGITKTCANVTVTTVADTDVGGVGGGTNLDAQLHDLSGGDFVGDHDVYLNGVLQRSGADAAANNDVYPGTSLPNGQLKFEKVVKIGDVICVISRA